MSKKGWIITLLFALLLGCGPLVVIPYWINRQFVDFQAHDDMRLVGQNTKSNISTRACFAHWGQHQTYRTERSNIDVWRKTKASWDTLSGDYVGHINIATYEDNTFHPLIFKSTVTYSRYGAYNSVLVTKQALLHLPTQLCALAP